jgi:hypothetical protein
MSENTSLLSQTAQVSVPPPPQPAVQEERGRKETPHFKRYTIHHHTISFSLFPHSQHTPVHTLLKQSGCPPQTPPPLWGVWALRFAVCVDDHKYPSLPQPCLTPPHWSTAAPLHALLFLPLFGTPFWNCPWHLIDSVRPSLRHGFRMG